MSSHLFPEISCHLLAAERYGVEEAAEDTERALAQGDQDILDRFKERTIQEYEAEKELKQAKEQEEPEA